MATSRRRHPYISRVDRPARRIVGWVVQVWHEGSRFTRYFSDKQFKGRRRAYAAAR